jgi:hypothetical protein
MHNNMCKVLLEGVYTFEGNQVPWVLGVPETGAQHPRLEVPAGTSDQAWSEILELVCRQLPLAK